MKPLLSICIPTYNRCEYLRKSIESIICQQPFKNRDVEIVISDNASDDGTDKFGKEIASKYSNIRYYRNPENIVDKNFPLAMSRGTGILRKLANDTFIYYPGCLKIICELVREYSGTKPQIFFLNKFRETVTDDFIECNNFNFFTKTAGTWTTWSGAFSLWEDDCKDIENDTIGCELHLWQCRKVYDLFEEKKHVLICNVKIIRVQGVKNKNKSYGFFNVFYNNHLKILKKYLDSGLLSAETYEYVRKEILYQELMNLNIVWEVGKTGVIFSEDEDPVEMTENVYKNESYWSDYLQHYKKQKEVFVFKRRIKTILKKLHIWDVLVALHIKEQ